MTIFHRSTLALIASVASLLPSLEATKVSSSVRVHLPKSLQKTEGYDHREALFGIPPYGGSILQNVQYTAEDLCSPFQPPKRWQSPFILMVNRGGCTFVQKVRNGQHSGAVAVVIADNTCQCKHEDICDDEENTTCEKHEPIMADDGSGYDITIPSILLFKQDADPLKKALVANNNVMLELSWSLPNPDDHVEWDLWTSPTDYASADFKYAFREAALALASRATFTPHMYIYDGIEAKCRNEDGENLCDSMCTSSGRYCATDPDGDFESGISGADVVKESVRRLCIWDMYGGDGTGMEWWDYVRGFSDSCDTSQLFMEDSCVKGVMENIEIDFDLVEQCIFEHGSLDEDEENSLLQAQIEDKKKNGIVILPVSYVNGVAVRGALEFATIFKAICAGFKHGTEPDICLECANCSDEERCVTEKRCADNGGKNIHLSTYSFIESLSAVAFVFTIIGAVLYTRQQRLMREQVRGIMKEYMPVEKNGLTSMEFDTALEQDEDAKGTFT